MQPELDPTFRPPSPIVISIWLSIAIWLIGWWILSATNYDPSIASALVTGLVSIIVGVVAAQIGAKATRQATEQAQSFHLQQQRTLKEAQVAGVIQAIYVELSCLWIIYRDEFEEVWKNLPSDEPLRIYYPLNQDYFTVYNANSSMIGQIPDESLRVGVVKAYLAAKNLVDGHLFNNRILDDISAMLQHRAATADSAVVTQLESRLSDLRVELKSYSPALRSTCEEARRALTRCFQR